MSWTSVKSDMPCACTRACHVLDKSINMHYTQQSASVVHVFVRMRVSLRCNTHAPAGTRVAPDGTQQRKSDTGGAVVVDMSSNGSAGPRPSMRRGGAFDSQPSMQRSAVADSRPVYGSAVLAEPSARVGGAGAKLSSGACRQNAAPARPLRCHKHALAGTRMRAERL